VHQHTWKNITSKSSKRLLSQVSLDNVKSDERIQCYSYRFRLHDEYFGCDDEKRLFAVLVRRLLESIGTSSLNIPVDSDQIVIEFL
jgi:hypothetical protein